MEDSVGDKVGEQMFGGRGETVSPVTAEQLREELGERVVRDENGVHYLRYPNQERGEQRYYPDGLIAQVGKDGSVVQINMNTEAGTGSLAGLTIEFDESGNRLHGSVITTEEREGIIGQVPVRLMVATNTVGESFNSWVIPGSLIIKDNESIVRRASRTIYPTVSGELKTSIILTDASNDEFLDSYPDDDEELMGKFRYVLGIK